MGFYCESDTIMHPLEQAFHARRTVRSSVVYSTAGNTKTSDMIAYRIFICEKQCRPAAWTRNWRNIFCTLDRFFRFSFHEISPFVQIGHDFERASWLHAQCYDHFPLATLTPCREIIQPRMREIPQQLPPTMRAIIPRTLYCVQHSSPSCTVG